MHSSSIIISVLLAISALAAGLGAAEPALQVSAETAWQGDSLAVRLEGPEDTAEPKISFLEADYPMFFEAGAWRAYLPVWVETKPGPHRLTASWQEGDNPRARAAAVTVKARDFGLQHLSLSASQEKLYTDKDVEREYKLIHAALKRFTAQTLWQGNFIAPVKGRHSTAFGVQRYRNKKKVGIHKGVDIAAPAGTEIRAAHAGVVALVAGDFKLHGKTTVIDHGRGVCTLYLHQSEILVKPGQVVKQGDIIGRVGQTGVATGPHLHYALYVGDTAVNPAWWEAAGR